MRIILTSFLLLFVMNVYSQAESPPVVSDNKHYVSSISYNFQGVPVSKSVGFYNDLGKAEQSQSWDVLTNRIWASEVRYDYFNRPVFQTLSAPINGTGSFGYRADFIRSNGSPIGITQYDTPSTVSNPPIISPEVNTLGWYYSSQNTIDPYQDITVYPYTRAVYSSLNPSAVHSVLGGNKINGQWLQSYSFTMASEKYTTYPEVIGYFANKRILKTVSRDVHGVETVVYADTDGNTLAAARSGCENPPCSSANRSVYSEILDKGFVDIHIPQGVTGSVGITGQVAGLHSLRIFNLITEQLVPYTANSTSTTLPAGFYRFEDVNNYYGKTEGATPIRISYLVNYYDFSVNKYDDADFLISSIQPLGATTANPLESTFNYNNLGELLSTTSPDEGRSEFKYRQDGQIRFSQNAEQAKKGSFSYTNYDVLGRPVESGVFYQEDFSFANNLNSIVDELDGLPAVGRSEQNFTVYDVPDSQLIEKLASCAIPYADYKQTFVAGNVSYTYTHAPFTTKTWYSYDSYGRVRWMIQEIPGLSCLKTIDYTYNPVDGQLVRVDYQRHNTSERFVHKYDYNIAGQLIEVSTSTNNTSFTRQAYYRYNDSGALIRTELGTNLQGVDYTYNLNGQLKAINHPSILNTLDPGGDGMSGSSFASDLFGMALDYYNGDYTRTNTPRPITSTSQGTDQYNGNIKATRWNTQLPNANHSAYTYQYNKNNWLTTATFGSANSTGVITPNPNQDYKVSNITYDANGNIKTLTRNGYTDANGTNSMDNLSYQYGVGSSAPASNRLLGVTDTQDNTDTNRYNDIRDQVLSVPTGAYHPLNLPINTSLSNYTYNDLGQLVVNYQDKIFYEYNASGLVTKINTFTIQALAESYKTVFYDDYTLFTTQNHGWVKASNTASTLGTFTFGSPLVFCAVQNGDELEEKYGYKSLQINGKPVVKKQLRVMPSTAYKLDFDTVLDKLIGYYPSGTRGPLEPIGPTDPLNPNPDPGSGSGGNNNNNEPIPVEQFQPIEPTLTVTVRRENGTVIHSQTISVPSQATLLCERYYEQHVGIEFSTLTEEYITIELTVGNNLTTSTDDEHKSKYQKTFLDNLHLQAAIATKVAFYYNDRGQRVRKESYAGISQSTSTYYVRDVAGSVMGVYESRVKKGPLGGTTIHLIENTIYGSGRIGVQKRSDVSEHNYALYELTDHLGNVRAIFRKTSAGVLALAGKTDYYPFGMPMPNKHSTDENYRYAFQGQEKDPETGMEAFELRLWDGRLGRWLTVDPYHEFHSPYVGMGNNPISLTDPDGGSTEGGGDPPGFFRRLWNKITGNTGSEYQKIPQNNSNDNDIAWSIKLEDAVVDNPHHIKKGVNSHLIRSNGYSANYGAVGSTTDGGLALPQDFGSWNSAGSDGRQWIGCMACHGSNGAYSTLASNSPSTIWGGFFGSVVPISRLMQVRGPATVTSKATSPFALTSTQPITLSKREFQSLVNDIKTNGITTPVEYTVKDGVKYIVNGHHRVYIAKRLGIKEVPVLEVPYKQGMEVMQEGKNPGYLNYIKY